MNPRPGVLGGIKALPASRRVKAHIGIISGAGLLDSGVSGTHLGELLHQVRPLFKGPIQRLVDGVGERIRNGELLEWLHVNRRGWGSPKRFSQIPLGDFLGADYGLQFVLGSSCRASSFQASLKEEFAARSWALSALMRPARAPKSNTV